MREFARTGADLLDALDQIVLREVEQAERVAAGLDGDTVLDEVARDGERRVVPVGVRLDQVEYGLYTSGSKQVAVTNLWPGRGELKSTRAPLRARTRTGRSRPPCA